MEGVMKRWKEEQVAEVEEESLVKRQAHHHMHVTSTTITTSKLEVQATEQTNGSSGMKQEQEIIQTEVNSEETNESSVIHVDSSLFSSVRAESERVGVITQNVQQQKDLYLQDLYQKTPTQGFYCPNCRTCIQTVLLLEETSAPPPPPPKCSSCFSFLIPIGSWLFPGWVQDNEISTIPEVQQPSGHSKGKLSDERTKVKGKIAFRSPETPRNIVQAPNQVNPIADSGKIILQPEHVKNDGAEKVKGKIAFQSPKTQQITVQAPKTPRITVQAPDQVNPTADSGKKILQLEHVKNDGADKSSSEADDKTIDSLSSSSEIPQDEHDLDGSKIKPSLGGLMFGAPTLATPEKDNIDISEKSEQPPQLEEVIVQEGSTELPPRTETVAPTQPDANQESRSSTTWEILKSIVYGGLVEFIASLGIVTSSASSDATTLNILVLSLANLIGGLFIIVHNILDLKSEQPRTNNVTNVGVDRYYQILGKRKHFYLHVFMAILSFIIFGLVPPLVYAFTFTESNNKDLKLAAVAVASAICITLLSIAKAHIQRPNSYLIYLKTMLQYLSTGAMTSVVSYLAGELVKELIEKLGWFDTESSSFALLLPEMSSAKPRFGSY